MSARGFAQSAESIARGVSHKQTEREKKLRSHCSIECLLSSYNFSPTNVETFQLNAQICLIFKYGSLLIFNKAMLTSE